MSTHFALAIENPNFRCQSLVLHQHNPSIKQIKVAQ
ncbi:Uncharacterised protein [Vibrio cholerae]|nr:Uncharacterised protein [Vibrio cholerae]